MTSIAQQAAQARQLMNRQSVGVLSTHSVDVDGYPFGSITPYVFSHDCEPVILIAEIAQHTRNIKANPKVSLTVFDTTAEDPQDGGRVTWLGEAAPVADGDVEAVRKRYLRYFPSARSYFEQHGFVFYRIGLRRARFIGGFGKIYWVEPDAMVLKNPFRESESGIVEHMNDGHKEALLHYCKSLAGLEASEAAMSGIDSEGFDLLADGRKVRIDFDTPISTPKEARDMLVKLAKPREAALA